MPGKCKFLNKWLEQPQYHAWLRNGPDIHKAHCKCCNKSFDISSMGETALQSHLKGGVKTVLGIKKNRCKMCRDLGNKNDGKIFKTLGIGEVEKIVGIEEIIENVLRTFF
jgi:hypothetical protein